MLFSLQRMCGLNDTRIIRSSARTFCVSHGIIYHICRKSHAIAAMSSTSSSSPPSKLIPDLCSPSFPEVPFVHSKAKHMKRNVNIKLSSLEHTPKTDRDTRIPHVGRWWHKFRILNLNSVSFSLLMSSARSNSSYFNARAKSITYLSFSFITRTTQTENEEMPFVCCCKP